MCPYTLKVIVHARPRELLLELPDHCGAAAAEAADRLVWSPRPGVAVYVIVSKDRAHTCHCIGNRQSTPARWNSTVQPWREWWPDWRSPLDRRRHRPARSGTPVLAAGPHTTRRR